MKSSISVETKKNNANGTLETGHLSPVSRTFTGVRDALFDEIDRIRAGTSDPKTANALARLCGEVNNSVYAQIALDKHLADIGAEGLPAKRALPSPIGLGS